MKERNCVASCREIEEANAGQQFSEVVTVHLRDCAKCQDFYKSRLKLRQMIASLGTVEAPADFGFRVRARIASERAGTSQGLSLRNLAIGFPSIALATLVLLVGGGLALRVWNSRIESPNIVRTEVPGANPAIVNQPSPFDDHSFSRGTPAGADSRRHEVLAADAGSRVQFATKQRSHMGVTLASARPKTRVATRDLSSVSAPVIKQEDALASLETVFPIEASPQPLRVSLDYAKRGSRTISVPALSFGSEGVLTGEGASMVRTSTKGVW